MAGGILTSILDSIRHRFGSKPQPDRGRASHRTTRDEELAALARHNDAEARIVGRTMADPEAIRAFGKGRPK